jgi:hypothetical protein
MLLTKMQCDGCGRRPGFLEWFRGELSAEGYPEWRHPAIAFRAAGYPMKYENREKARRIFEALFGRPMPDDEGFLCPHCQKWVESELPGLAAQVEAQSEQPVTQQYSNPPGG